MEKLTPEKYFAVVKTKKGLSHLVVGGPRVLHSVSCAPICWCGLPRVSILGRKWDIDPNTALCRTDGSLNPHFTHLIAHCAAHNQLALCTQFLCLRSSTSSNNMLSDIALDIKEQLNDIDISLVVIFSCFLFCVFPLQREFNQVQKGNRTIVPAGLLVLASVCYSLVCAIH